MISKARLQICLAATSTSILDITDEARSRHLAKILGLMGFTGVAKPVHSCMRLPPPSFAPRS